MLNEQNSEVFRLSKLTKVIEEFLRSHYLKSFGYNKRRYQDYLAAQRSSTLGNDNAAAAQGAVQEEEEEYYYDEEVPEGEESKVPPVQVSAQVTA